MMPPPYDWLNDSPPITAATLPKHPSLDSARWQSLLFTLLALTTLALLVLLIIVISTRRDSVVVTVIVDGDAFPAQAQTGTVADLLTALNLDTTSGDRVNPSPETALQHDMIIRIDRARGVTLSVNGEVRLLWTPLTSPAEILAAEGVHIGADDLLVIDGTPATLEMLTAWTVPVSAIMVRHVMPIDVEIEGDPTPRTLLTTRDTVGEALFDAGITLYLADSVSVDLNAPVQPNMMVRITRASPVSIIVDGETLRARAQGSTVADALAYAGVALNGLDYAIPAVESRLLPGMSIRVIRVREDYQVTETVLPYESLLQADPTLEIDQRRVLQAGREGLQRTRMRVRYENGFAIARTEESTEIVTEAQNEIVGYGTNIVYRTLDTPDGTITYWRVLRMYATSYHPAALGGDSVTATGATLQRGIVGANPNILPYDTQIYVAGYGTGSIQDTGGARSSPYWVDLGYSDADYVGWSRYVDVYLLAPPPPDIVYLLPNWTPLRNRPDTGG